jgi:FdhD protein
MPAVTQTTILKVNDGTVTDTQDLLATEEPLEIRLTYGPANGRISKSISVTMRTPGHDQELATGFLYTEGIILSAHDITGFSYPKFGNENILSVALSEEVAPHIGNLDRNFYTTSSCGVCGKASIDAVRTTCPIPESFDTLRIPVAHIYQLPDLLRRQQSVFENTGGLHGCALFDTANQLIISREDVGRHNALDKLIGSALSRQLLPLQQHVLLLSGRASFELIQKAIMAGIKIIAAVGAPSSLAAELAVENGITLMGFLRGSRFNIYSGAERILL